VQGVRSVQANTLTGNILIQYDPTATNEQAILKEVHALDLDTINAPDDQPPPPPVQTERRGQVVRARIAVRGLDYDQHLAKRVLEHLEQRSGVMHAKVNRLTGRVLVEFLEHEEDLDDLIAEITQMELPEEDRPAHPLDPGPFIQGVTCTIGATLGIGVLAMRRLFGFQEPLPGSSLALHAASIIGLLQGFPPIRYGLRKLLGRTVADLLFNVPGIITLTLAESPFGLALVGSESLRLLTEVQARRAAWLRRKERVANAPSTQPDAIIRLETGERTPLAAKVLEGMGTAIGLDGMPLPVVQGNIVPPGARLYGGPFVLKLQNDKTFGAFIPQPRPAPAAPSLYDYYLKASSQLSLVYTAATALFTRSFTKTLVSMLLVNSRTAAIGLDYANLGAAARVLRAGVTNVGTRTDRTIRLPRFLLLAGVPEGLPLLTKVGEAGVARRLSSRDAFVRRLSSIEALGRVNVACADKTGTMTKGRLVLSMVTGREHEAKMPGTLPADLRHVLLAAALASPHPDAPDAHAHPTDVAIVQDAMDAGLGREVHVKHEAELAFDPVRSFHATVAQELLYIKGAPEAVLLRCTSVFQRGEKHPLDESGQHELLEHSRRLAERGLRVLMVAEGPPDTPLDDPQGLTALGFVGISDPLRPTVQAAVLRCHEAGVRVIMITGDHPATARTIAREAGLLNNGGEVLTATEIAELQNGELDERLEHAVVIARATPLGKLRIIESLQRRGHTVAMTGDGVNDAPALRLADVGVAMGWSGTEVARQTAEVVIADDDFSTLVEAFVEGRSFWHNIRRALGLLLGGNLGELGLVAGATILGTNTPLTARQILAVNAITDILPALAVALQQPEHRNLAGLRREGAAALNKPLRNEVLRRGTARTVPALASYLIMLGVNMLPEARSVAFANFVATQLAQTLDSGWAEGSLTRPVFGAVAGSVGVLLAAFTFPSLRDFLQLVMPSPLGWALIGAGALTAVGMSRVLASPLFSRLELPPLLPAPGER